MNTHHASGGLQPIVGPDDVRLDELAQAVSSLERDPDTLTALGGDESVVESVRPGAAVLARSVDDIVATMRWAHMHGVPVTPRGAGSGKAGGCIPVPGGLVLSLAPMNSIRSVEVADGYAEVEPGVVTGTFRDVMEQEHRLFYPPDPASLDWCTLGGNVATNAGGPVALKYGVTGRFVMGLTLVLADGTVVDTGRRQPKDVAGYDLTSLVVGSEGTLAIVAGVRLGLMPLPREVRTAALAFASLEDAVKAQADARQAGIVPRALELIDEVALARIRATWDRKKPPFRVEGGKAVLLVEVDGPRDSADAALEELFDGLEIAPISVSIAATGKQRSKLWATRREMSERVKRGAAGWVTEDVTVPPSQVASVIRELAMISEKHELTIASYGHVGDGNLHVNVLWDAVEDAVRAPVALDDVMGLALRVGGTVTGEHGVGRAKRRWLPDQIGATSMGLQKRLKDVWDPRGILNPGVGL